MSFSRMSPAGFLTRSINGFRKHLSRFLVPRLISTVEDGELKLLGVGDGAWPVVELNPKSVCYCVGVGVNATFDIELARAGHEVHSFDPTPKALAYAEEVGLGGQGVAFHPLGVWNTAKTLRFYEPSNQKHANYSVVDLHGTGKFIEAKCESLVSIMEDLGHDEIDLIKLDVEGSWQVILEHLIEVGIRPGQICVEFDSPTSTGKIMSAVKLLEGEGYAVRWFEGENFLFIKSTAGR